MLNKIDKDNLISLIAMATAQRNGNSEEHLAYCAYLIGLAGRVRELPVLEENTVIPIKQDAA